LSRIDGIATPARRIERVRRSLQLHPDSVCDAVTRIDVDVVRTGSDVLGLRYVVQGRIADLALPPPVKSARADDLWQHSCFEAFLGDEEGEGYVELNVAPSTLWAGYRFTGYREDRVDAPLPTPRIEVETAADRLELRVALRLRYGGGPRRLGLSAVIEEISGRKSWWALDHPPGAPDFHHRDCFQIELPPLG
jgi:hypothetical protein